MEPFSTGHVDRCIRIERIIGRSFLCVCLPESRNNSLVLVCKFRTVVFFSARLLEFLASATPRILFLFPILVLCGLNFLPARKDALPSDLSGGGLQRSVP
jgi:hypothetical protein